MERNFTAIIKKDGDWWIGWIEEVPGVNCQESSKQQLLDSLQLALKEMLAYSKIEATTAAGTDFEELPIAV